MLREVGGFDVRVYPLPPKDMSKYSERIRALSMRICLL